MITRQTITYSAVLFFLSAILTTLPFASTALAANMPLEIINIKPAGSGNPAIPSSNRIFMAYPGIEYNIRAAVIGGRYPYTYSLSNAPNGMTINSRTGEITWGNPQSNASNIQLTVVDSESTSVQTKWSITVTDSTDTFRFVQAGYSGTQNGSISQPYSSLANAIAVGGNVILYLRQGSYSYNGIPGGDRGVWATRSTPRTWMGYPGETATIHMNDTAYASSFPFYLDRITFTDMDYNGIIMYGPISYYTIRRCGFTDFTNSNPSHANQGVIMALGSEGNPGSYSVIQDNYITNFRSSSGDLSAIGSLYRMTKLLIENNHIFGNNSRSVDRGIFTKTGTHAFTVRGNKIIMVRGNPIYYGNYSPTPNDGNDYLFNLCVVTGERNAIFQAFEWYQGDTRWHRNTIITDVMIRACDQTGPYTFSNNVISNPNRNYSQNDGTVYNFINFSGGTRSCFTIENQLASTNATTLVDPQNEYKLVPAQSQFVGSRGWQLSDGLTPLEVRTFAPGFPAPPQNVKIIK